MAKTSGTSGVSCPCRAPEAFLIGREFAHLHPGADHSLHAMLPPDFAEEAVRTGWAEQHPVARRGLSSANAVILYAPRDHAELDIVTALIEASHSFASTAQQPAAPELQARNEADPSFGATDAHLPR